MSGIAGMVNPNEDISNQCSYICSISDSIRTRGPNGTGLYASTNLILTHRLGSEGILLESPPITKVHFMDNEFISISNGVLYNYNQLRSELEGHGCSFRGKSYSELILYAYAIWQEECFNKLNGIYSFALWMKNEKTLILARDHIGAKPLYYAIIDGTLVFASEIKGIIAHPHFKCTIGIDGLSELICLSPRNTPGSAVIKGIHEVRPGHYIQYTPDGVTTKRYWKIPEREHGDDLIKTTQTIKGLILDAVKGQMNEKVPFCGLLSGGLYSSLITSIICENMSKNESSFNTWSVDFEKSSKTIQQKVHDNTDTSWIRLMCRLSGTRHHYIILSSYDLYENLLEALEAKSLPGLGDYDTSLMLLCREISKEYSIMLSGDCSDEIFGGGSKASDNYSSGKRRFPWANNLAEKISIFNSNVIETIKPYEFIEKSYEEALHEYAKFSGNASGLKKGYEAQWFSLYWNLPFLLDRLDRMGMAFNLQARIPLCDYRLIEYFWNIPQELKQLNGVDRGLLRESIKDMLPSAILERPKNPYPRIFESDYENKIKSLLKDIIYDTSSPLRHLLELRTLEAMMKQHPDPLKRYTSRSQLYSWLIQLNYFLKNNSITLL